MTATHTRTHVYVKFANPFLVCDTCRDPVWGFHDPTKCGETPEGWFFGRDWNMPCEHRAGVTSVCPSWGPVDGCRCLAHLGYVPHKPLPVEEATPDA